MLTTILLVIATLISIPLLVVGSQCLVTLIFGLRPSAHRDQQEKSVAYKILIPAHNEAAIIVKTLTQLIPELPDSNPHNILLVADNCSDDTAKIAKNFNIKVLERTNTAQRGKGYALDFGIQHLRKNTPPDVLVILDADCETSKNALIALINSVAQNQKPAQMVYLMRIPGNASLKQKVSGFAWMLKNKIRLIAMNALRLPVSLTGTGMAFPWQVFDLVKIGHGNIVEDMQLGIDCAINGFPSTLCAEAVVYSDFPEQTSAELSQRTRWEHGHLQTILQQVPVLFKAAWQQKRISLLAYALDIGVPPLSLLVLIAFSSLILLTLLSLKAESVAPFSTLLLSFMYFAAMLACVWRRFGQAYLSASELAGIPIYIISKLTIYFAFIFKRQKEWVRTDRDS